MSEGTHGPSWYKILGGGLAVTYLFFLLMVSQCTFSLTDPLSLFNTFLCVLYVGLTILCLIIAIPLCLVGIEHAKRNGKNRSFYIFLILYFMAGLFAVILYRFL